jgi:hypothetical protein
MESSKLVVALGLLLAAACSSKESPPAPPLSKEPEPAASAPVRAEVTATPPPSDPSALPPPSVPSVVVAAADSPKPAAAPKVVSTKSPSATEPVAAAAPPAPDSPKAAASPPAPAPIKRGAAVSGEGFSVWLETRATHAVGQNAPVTVVITAKGPYKCNDKYPYKLKLDPPSAGVSYPTPVVSGAQVGKERTTMPFSVSTSAKGNALVSGTLSFSVCTEDRCLVEKQKVSVGFAVE